MPTKANVKTLLELAERCEAATGPSVLLDARIYHDGLGNPHPTHNEPYCPRFTASLDAALSLVPEGKHQDVMYEAVRALGKRFNLHITFFPAELDYGQVLARHVCAAALRARANMIEGDGDASVQTR